GGGSLDAVARPGQLAGVGSVHGEGGGALLLVARERAEGERVGRIEVRVESVLLVAIGGPAGTGRAAVWRRPGAALDLGPPDRGGSPDDVLRPLGLESNLVAGTGLQMVGERVHAGPGCNVVQSARRDHREGVGACGMNDPDADLLRVGARAE